MALQGSARLEECISKLDQVFVRETQSAPKDIWNLVVTKVNAMSYKLAFATEVAANHEIVFTGVKDEVETLSAECKAIVEKEITLINRKRNTVTETITNKSALQLKWLLKMKAEQQLKVEYPFIVLNIDHKKRKYEITGLAEEIKAGKARLNNVLQQSTVKHVQLKPIQLEVLKRTKILNKLMFNCQNQDVKAVFWLQHERGAIDIMSNSDAERSKLEKYICDKIKLLTFQGKQYSLDVIKLAEWSKFERELRNTEDIEICITPKGPTVSIEVCGYEANTEKIEADIKDFFKRNAIVEKKLKCFPCTLKFISNYRMGEIDQHKLALAKYRAEITMKEPNAISIRCSQSGLDIMEKFINDLILSVKTDVVRIDSYMKSIFRDRNVILNGFESRHQVVIIESKELDHFADSDDTVRNLCLPEVTNIRYSGPNNEEIKVIFGDICKHKCSAIVNAANEELNHAGGLAAALSNSGF